MTSRIRALLVFGTAIVPVCVLVFLVASDFFAGWYGAAVSVRPAATDDPKVFEVLIVEPTGGTFRRAWPADLVREFELPVDAYGIVPDPIDPARPVTRKDRFTLSYTIEGGEDVADTELPTTSPASLGLAVLVFVLGIFGRNMIVSGSPFSLEPRGVYLPKAQAPSGQPVPSRGTRPRKGPPPGGRRKGRGRR